VNSNGELTQEVSLNQDLLCVFQVNPSFPHLFATGGDEREVCVWDVNQLEKPIWQAKNVILLHEFLRTAVNLKWIGPTYVFGSEGSGVGDQSKLDASFRTPTRDRNGLSPHSPV
jgi:ribosome biogenesis protein NSA1